MAKNYTKKEAVSIAISAARQYRDNFLGKNLLFIVTDKHKKVSSLAVRFDASNFHHLTGLELTHKEWSCLDFFNSCIDGRLSEKDVELRKNGTTHQKLSVLPLVFKNTNLSATMMGNYNNSHPFLYTEKLVGGVKWALGFRDVSGGNGEYVPDTLLEGDIRDNVYDTYRIIAAYIKGKEEAEYSRMIYRAKKVDYEKLTYPNDWGDLPRPAGCPEEKM